LEDTADAFSNIIAAADAFFQVLTDGDINSALEAIKKTAEDIAQAMYTAVLAAAMLKAEIAKRQAEAAALQEQGRGLRIGPVVIGTADEPRVAAAGQEAFNEVMEDQVTIIEELNKRLTENKERTEERGKATEGNIDDDMAAGQAILDQAAALEELANAEDAASEAREKLSEKLAGIALDRERKLTEIMREQGRKMLEDEIEAAQKREDLARENAQKIEDIWIGHQQDIADAARDLSRNEEDIARKAARDRVEVDRDNARERINIETEYRQELERIRDRFNQSAAEAERNNDAQAYLEAMRQRDMEVQDAKRDREDKVADAGQKAAEQREKINEQLRYELEDARIANARKLEDLQIRLDRELEAQRLNYQRDLEEQALNEQRKAEERARANQQEVEDFIRKEAEKLQDLEKSEAAQFETIKKYEDLKREYRVTQAQKTVTEVNAALARINPFGRATPTASQFAGTLGATFGRRQYGGDVEAGRGYIIGEQGPEVFIPRQAGAVLPNAAVSMPGSPSLSNVYNNQRSMSNTINLADSLFDNPTNVRKMQNIILGVLAEAL